MPQYDLSRLKWQDFEHLVQSLLKHVFGHGATPFGDGPDGGREATFRGTPDFPSKAQPWTGYTVVQCKYRNIDSTATNTAWLRNQLRAEFKKLTSAWNASDFPDYYLLVTNVALTPQKGTGGRDRTESLLRDLIKDTPIKGFAIWAFDDLCRFLDLYSDIRTSYAAYVTPGDVLSEVLKLLKQSDPSFDQIVLAYLQRSMMNDRAARLESAGQEFEHRVPLASVFIDLPATENAEQANNAQDYGRLSSVTPILQQLIDLGSYVLRPSVIKDRAESRSNKWPPSSSAIVGGPGQGKSTLTQFLCQIYRAALLTTFDPSLLTADARTMLDHIRESLAANKRQLPTNRRFPFRISLQEYASDLARNKKLSMIEFIRKDISTVSGLDLSLDHLKAFFREFPWLIILDGLDEVPYSSNRRAVLKELDGLRVILATLNSDTHLVATTRPQGYTDEFDSSIFTHWYLTPLTAKQALHYGNLLLTFRCGVDSKRRDVIYNRLRHACRNTQTSRLMISPLQVTIMATLVERLGEPPRERYRLFEQYYRTIYEREIGRQGPQSAILSTRKTDIDIIHYRVGLLLQSNAERAGQTDAKLSSKEFEDLVKERLTEICVTGEELEHLVTQITDSSLDRLVFLVRPDADSVAFEVRSLQEFMAAEAILRGSDSVVVKRLETIAPIPYWGNVFLFAVGHCFAEREHLLPHIDFLCRSLNDRASDEIGAAAKFGSELATSIVFEGLAGSNPKYRRLLLSTALEGVDTLHRATLSRLASCFTDDVSDLFLDALTSRLRKRVDLVNLGAWLLLLNLVRSSVAAGARLLRSNWPVAPDEQHLILRAWAGSLQPNRLTFLERTMLKLEPKQAAEYFMELSDAFVDVPEWLVRAASFYGSDGDLNGIPLMGLRSPEGVSFGTHAAFDSYYVTGASILSHVSGRFHRRWLPILEAIEFAKEPDKDSLARALEAIAAKWHSDFRDPEVFEFLPWPIGGCLRMASGRRDLLRLAEAAREGHLGSRPEWKIAEERFVQIGVSKEDLSYRPGLACTFDRHIGVVGFPHVGSIALPNTANEELLRNLYSVWCQSKGCPWREEYAHYIIALVSLFGIGRLLLVVGVADLVEMAKILRPGRDVKLGSFEGLEGSTDARSFVDAVCRGQLSVSFETSESSVAALHHWITKYGDENWGLWRLAALAGESNDTTEALYELYKSFLLSGPNYYGLALGLPNSAELGWMKTYAREVWQKRRHWPDLVPALVDLISESSSLLTHKLAVLETFRSCALQDNEIGDVSQFYELQDGLEALLSSRQTELWKQDVWRSLDLPRVAGTA